MKITRPRNVSAITAFLVLSTLPSGAAILAQYGFGTPSTTSSASSDMDVNSTASAFGIGMNGSEFGVDGTDNGFSSAAVSNGGTAAASPYARFARSNFTTTTQSGAISGNDYFKFTLTPGALFEADLTSLFFDYSTNGNSTFSNTASFFVRSSVDAFAANLGTTVSATHMGSTGSATYQRQTIDLSGAEYQNLTGPVEFRIYIYNSVAPTNNAGVARFDNVTLMGSVVAVPEPTSFALAGVFGLLGILRRRVSR